jgi:farnesyl diphosphate synthase
VHKQFDEATAILAGDGLLTLAFEVVSDPATHPDADIRAGLVLALAQAAGVRGMVGGQMIDLEAETKTLNLDEITQLQKLKTGALIGYGCEAGAMLGRASDDSRHALRRYADTLGLAFQIADDLLDVEGNVEEMGKAVQKDADAGKATFVSLLGVDGARERANTLVDEAVGHLSAFDERADMLRQTARFVIDRRN